MAKQTLTREQQMLTAEQKEKLRYHPEKVAAKKKAAAAKLAAEKKEAKELGVSVESLRAMKAEAANESSAADFSRSYKKGGLVSNCGASVKATQKGTVKLSCGGMAHKKKKK